MRAVAVLLAVGSAAWAQDPAAPAAPAVRELRDVRYWDGPDAHPRKHLLDLFLPVASPCPERAQRVEGSPSVSGGTPLLCFVHGGAWMLGDKDVAGPMHENVGRALAARGIATACINYRLSPSVRHPEHVRDVARAVAWLRAHAAEHGADPARLVLAGHSAGGHLVALVTLDPRWLKEQGLDAGAICGVCGLAGAYVIPPEPRGPLALVQVFGEDVAERRLASPVTHVLGGHPPFLVAWADRDMPGLQGQARLLVERLRSHGDRPETCECADRDHITLVARIGTDGDLLTDAVAAFIARVAPPRSAAPSAPLSLGYVLQAEKLAPDRAGTVAALAACDRDILVLDAAFDGTAPWTREELDRIRAGRPGRRILAYVSIGEAEDWRAYWQRAWDADRDGKPDAGAPPWLVAPNPDWPGGWGVRYWDPAWRGLARAAVADVATQGFDGAWLDRVDAFEDFERDPATGEWLDDRPNPDTGATYRRDMVALLHDVSAAARARVPGFAIFLQNGEALLRDPALASRVDGIGLEDVFTDGTKPQPAAEVAARLAACAPLRTAGKPVLAVEYPTTPGARAAALAGAKAAGLPCLLAPRALDALGDAAR